MNDISAFVAGVIALPLSLVSLLVLARVYVATWDALSRWVRSVRPRRIAEVASYDVATGGTRLWVSKRAPLLASLGASGSIYLWKALPGFVVIVARDAKANPSSTESERLIRDALSEISIADPEETR